MRALLILLATTAPVAAQLSTGNWTITNSDTNQTFKVVITPVLAANHTKGGATLPPGWKLKESDTFGQSGNVNNFAELHKLYYEGQYYNRNADGTVRIPNIVINNEQQTYVHFEQAMKFWQDHMTIEAHGQPDGTITSGEIVSHYTTRNFCVEAKYTIPRTYQAWPGFWNYAAEQPNDHSEFDVEQPITEWQGVHDVTMHNIPNQGNLVIYDNKLNPQYMNWVNWEWDGAAQPHVYTICYNDNDAIVSRWIDGNHIYDATFKWNASMGGTGHGNDATTIFNLAAGGNWPGHISNPSQFKADLDLYSIEWYGP